MPRFRMRCAGPQDRSKIAVQHCRDTLVSADGCYRASRHDFVTPSIVEKKTPNNLETHICCPLLRQRLCNMTSFLNLLIRLPGSQYVSKDQGFTPRGKPITPGDAT